MYKICSQISWADVIDKLNHEVHSNTVKNKGTTYVLTNNYRPNTLQKAYNEAIGEMKYFIQEEWIKLVPGEHVAIPKGVYHTPVVLTPRVTLSFSYV